MRPLKLGSRPIALRLTSAQITIAKKVEALSEAMPEGATLLANNGYDTSPENYLSDIKLICARLGRATQ